jgi:hypothetical protein
VERSRLKTIMILILALLNICLLGSLVSRIAAERESRQQAAEQLVALFAAENIALDANTIPDKAPPSGQTLTRSPNSDQALAAAFLGDGLSSTDQGGGIYTYGSNYGAARCSSNGTFDIIGTQITEDAESFCRKFCRENHYKNLSFILDETGSGTATAVRYYDGYPVFNCTITFTIESGAITKVSGTHLPDATAESDVQDPLSAVAALSLFLGMRRESGALVSVITEMYLCYELQGTTTSPITLTPAWCIVTDTASYYVNCYTAAITHN